MPVDRALTPTTGNTQSGLPVDFDMPITESDDGAITIELPDGGVIIQLGEEPENESVPGKFIC